MFIHVFSFALFIHLPFNNNCSNKQIVHDLWKLTHKPIGMWGHQGQTADATLGANHRQMYLTEPIVGRACFDRVGSEGSQPSYKGIAGRKKGMFQRSFVDALV